MGPRPQAKLTVRFHQIANPRDPAWDQWMEAGDPSRLVAPLPGPPDPWSGDEIDARADEYKKILARLTDLRRQYRDYRLARRAQDLDAQKHRDKKDLPTFDKKKYTHEEIANMLSKEFQFLVSRTRVDHAISDWTDCLSDWPSGNTHSVTHSGKKPRHGSD